MQAENPVRGTKSLCHVLHVTCAALAIAACCRAGSRWARRASVKVSAGSFWSWGKDRTVPSGCTRGSLWGARVPPAGLAVSNWVLLPASALLVQRAAQHPWLLLLVLPAAREARDICPAASKTEITADHGHFVGF